MLRHPNQTSSPLQPSGGSSSPPSEGAPPFTESSQSSRAERRRRIRVDPNRSPDGPRDFVAVGRVLGLTRVTRLAAEFRTDEGAILSLLASLSVPTVEVDGYQYFNLFEFVKECFRATSRPSCSFGEDSKPSKTPHQWTEDELLSRLWWYFNVMQVARRKALLTALQDSPCFFGVQSRVGGPDITSPPCPPLRKASGTRKAYDSLLSPEPKEGADVG